MAKHKFKPGHNFGKGRPRKPSELVELQAMNHLDVANKMSQVMRMNPETFKVYESNPNNTMLDIAVFKLMKRIVENDDYQCFDFFLNRTVGKVKDTVEVDLSVRQREKAHDEIIDVVPREKLIELVRLKSGDADE